MNQMKEKQHLQIDYAILGIKKIRYNGKDYNFTDALKTTYAYLKGWKEAFPSYNKIADVFGITRDAAKERVKSLEAMGLVERIERAGHSNYYFVKEIDFSNVKGRSYSENKGTRQQVREQEAVTQTSPQEPQQSATNPALPSDVVKNEPGSSSDDNQDEQQTESPNDVYCASPPASKVELVMTEMHLDDFEDGYEENEELEDWERLDNPSPSQIKPSSISQAMRSQLYGKDKRKKGDYTEHIPF
ncbi:hypothetical protein ACRQ84_06205 [Enterobacter ludwigii]